MSGFTAGPWVSAWAYDVDEWEPDGLGIVAIGAGGLCEISHRYYMAPSDYETYDAADRETKANARLVAAAPNLFKALKELLMACDHIDWDYRRSTGQANEVIEKAQAALKRATLIDKENGNM